MIPTKSMKSKLAYMNQRNPDGSLMSRDHLLRRPLVVETEQEISSCFNSGGAGCFAKPRDYCREYPIVTCPQGHFTERYLPAILANLLNNGTSPTTGSRILSEATMDEMFRNQIPEFPNFGSQGIPASKAELTNTIPAIYPVEGNPPQDGVSR